MVVTHQNTLCRSDGSMCKWEFEHVLLRQLRCSVLRNMRRATALASDGRTDNMELVMRGINRLLFDTQKLIYAESDTEPSLSPPFSPQARTAVQSARQYCEEEGHGGWRRMTQIASDVGELGRKVNVLTQKVDSMQNFIGCQLQDMNLMIARLASFLPHHSQFPVCYSSAIQPNMMNTRATSCDMQSHQFADKNLRHREAAPQGDGD